MVPSGKTVIFKKLSAKLLNFKNQNHNKTHEIGTFFLLIYFYLGLTQRIDKSQVQFLQFYVEKIKYDFISMR